MNWNILYKYVQGICEEEELRELGNWLRKDPANEDLFISFIEEWDGEENIRLNPDARKEWDEFKKENLQNDSGTQPSDDLTAWTDRVSDTPTHTGGKNPRKSMAYWAYATATIVLLLGALFYVVRNYDVIEDTEPEEVAYQEINTVRGQRTNMKFSDGTKVVLNSSSSLQIPKNYGRDQRKVYLEGEAFFEVKHDQDKPFIVITHQTYARDLGTQFNVSAYDSSSMEVAVKEGKVSMGKMEKEALQEKETVLTPNKLGRIDEKGSMTVADIEDIDRYVGWADGKLAFRRTPLPEVMKRLEQWYDVDIELVNEGRDLSKRTLTATYDNMPLNEVLRVLSISMNISYTREGRKIIFHNKDKSEQL